MSEVLPAVEKSRLAGDGHRDLAPPLRSHDWHWQQRFAGNRDAIASLRDERFCRMIEFYLAGCELAFRRMGHMNWQMQLARRADALPTTRTYMQSTLRTAA